jgi:signal transduction histidine kinase
MGSEAGTIDRLTNDSHLATRYARSQPGPMHSLVNYSPGSAPPSPLLVLVSNTVQMMLEGISEQACLLDADATVIAANQAWKGAADCPEYEGLKIGTNYLDFMRRKEKEAGKGSPISAAVSALCEGERKRFQYSFRPLVPADQSYAKLQLVGLVYQGNRYVLLRYIDTTDAWNVRQRLRSLKARVAHARARERRSIARELRQSTASLLQRLGRDLTRLGQSSDKSQMGAALASCSRAIELVQREVRAMTLVCHPPSLADYPFATALEALVAGFCQRLGIHEEIEIRGPADVLTHDQATMLYCVTQEMLLNVLHHRQSSAISMRLNVADTRVRLVIEDKVGEMHPSRRSAMRTNLSGLKECLEDLGGKVAVYEVATGTRIIATMLRERKVAER